MNPEIAKRAQELVQPMVEQLGYRLAGVSYKTGELTITIDRAGHGIGVEDCARVSRVIDPMIEQADLIKENYQLVVSSPGIE